MWMHRHVGSALLHNSCMGLSDWMRVCAFKSSSGIELGRAACVRVLCVYVCVIRQGMREDATCVKLNPAYYILFPVSSNVSSTSHQVCFWLLKHWSCMDLWVWHPCQASAVSAVRSTY
jgi:hypothetical protein